MCSNNNILNQSIINARSFSHLFSNQQFPNLKWPSRVGEYCVSAEGIFEKSASRLYFLTQLGKESFPFSLNANCNGIAAHAEAKLSNSHQKYLENLFFFLLSARPGTFIKRNDRGRLQLEMDFVCTRQVLQLMMCTPYEKDNWTIAVSKYRNTIYMCQVESSEAGSSSHFDCELLRQEMMKVLRQRCLVARDGATTQPSPGQQKDLSGQYYCIFTTDICGINVLYDAPVIAQHNPNPFIGMPKTFVDLYIRLDTMNRAEWSAHNSHDVLKWWAESFLVGIQTVYIACHDKHGIVHRIKNKQIRDLYREYDTNWSPNVCGNFLHCLLGTIQKLVAHVDSASTVYLLDYNANNGHITYRATEDRNIHSFIPDWYRVMLEENMDHLNAEVRFAS